MGVIISQIEFCTILDSKKSDLSTDDLFLL